MAHRPVGIGSSFNYSNTAATSSEPFSVQSTVLRIVTQESPVHVLIGSEPEATVSDYYIPSNQVATLALTKAINRVTGIKTGTTTEIFIPEGMQIPFGVGDYVSLSNSTYHNFTHAEVLSIDTTSTYDGYFQTKMTVDFDSSEITEKFSNQDSFVTNSLKISALGIGSGTLYYQQVQISGVA